MAAFAALMAPAAAFGGASPQVSLATPGVGDGAVERFTLRFNVAMVPLGDPRAAAPFKTQCAGQGRWVDQQTWVYAFAQPLGGDQRCGFDAVEDFKSVGGYTLTGQSHFEVDAGGPVARAVLPSSGDGEIEENQAFLVATTIPATRESIAANAYCAVEGIGEKIPVDLLPPDAPRRLLSAMSTRDYEAYYFLGKALVPFALLKPGAAMRFRTGAKIADTPDAAAQARALDTVVGLKCRRPLPPGRDMALVWSGKIVGRLGKPAGADQRFDFTVRKPFAARFECTRVNAAAGCNPVEPAYVRFSAPVPMAAAAAVRIRLADGRELSPSFSDSEKRQQTIADVQFSKALPFDTAAQVALPADVRDESGRPLTNATRFPLAIRFDRAPPLVKYAAPFGILEARQGGVLPVTVRNVEPALQGRRLGVGGRSLRVDGSDGEIARWLRTVDAAGRDDIDVVHDADGEVIRRTNHTGDRSILPAGTGRPLTVPLPGKGRAFEVVGIPLGKPGFYVVELASPTLGRALLGRNAPRYVATAALVTNLAVHFKWGRERSLAWVTALDTGKPVAGALVTITDSCTGARLMHGTTDRSGGVLTVPGLPEPETYGSCEDGSHPLMVSARAGDDMSFALTSWGEGIRPYDFDLPYGYSAPGQVMHTVFDRALLRQGETIHMKHLLRAPVGAGFAIPPGFTGTLRLSHRGSDQQFDLPLAIDARGVGETSWTAPAGAPMGDYDLSVIADERAIATDQSFRVDEFRLPTMRATVTGPDRPAVRPRALPLDLYVGYLSGGGAANLPVDVRVGWFRHTDKPEGYDSYTFGGQAVTEGVTALDSDGGDEASPLPPTQTLPATLGADGAARTSVDVPTLDGLADMRVEMDYQDADGEVLTASRSIPIHPSGVQLGIRTHGWLMKHDDLRLRFVALGLDGKPLKGRKVAVTLYSRQVLTARRRLIGGFYAYDNQMRTTRLAKGCTATTDAQGLASCAIDPGVSGEVFAVATSADGDGNVARAVTSIWLAGDDDWWFGGDNGDRMDVVPEKLAYAAGETARFQVRMPFRAATALVTVEREGVLSSFVTELSGTDPVVAVKMPGSYAPDVYVSVMAVRGRIEPGWSGWLRRIAETLGLVAKSEPASEPTALVDLAKPAYRLGIAKVKVGWEAHRLGVTVRAARDRYAPRETADVVVQVRRPDGKPAASADVAFAAVDEALLQLAPNESWDVLTALMGDRPLSVLTATAQMQVVGKRHYGRKAVEAGGGGGGDAAAALNRENFQPVLLWRGHVPLDAEGRARVAVPLSDALSAFKLVAIATDGSQLYGTGSTGVRTQQDLSVYPGVPPLVREGDWFAAAFTLRNGSSKPMTVTATVDVFPRIATGRPITVTVPAGRAVPVAWNLGVPAGLNRLRWQLAVRTADGRAADRVTITQDVVPAVPIETWAQALVRVGADTAMPIAPPAGALPGRGSVDIGLADTLAPPLAGVRDYMARYPYICFEQRLSRMVVFDDASAWRGLAGELPTYQAENGLLRYFPSPLIRGSEALTSYVVAVTAAAGWPLPEGPRRRMIDALKAVIDGRLRSEDFGDVRLQKLAAFTALARANEATPAMIGQVGMAPAEMPTANLADYIVALDRLGAAPQRAQAEGVLRARLVYEGTRLDLSDAANSAWWLMQSADEAAVKAAAIAVDRPGWQDDAPKMMVGVATRQQRGHWDTTVANAWGALLVRRFAAAYPAQAIQGTTTLSLAGRTVTRAWPLAEQRGTSFALPPMRAPLSLRQTGGEGPWATVSVRAAVPLRAPLAAGYRLTKTIEVVQARTRGRLTRGDVLRVTLSVAASAERSWVVVSDPVPAGATIVGNLGGQSQLLAADGAKDAAAPSYVERGRDAWRGYFAWLPRGTTTVSYTVRLNGAGRFTLPPSRVEAMYSPAIRAAVPNAPITVAQR